MDDFEAPSFSLGLDEEIHESSKDHAAQPHSNPFKLSSHNKHKNVSSHAGGPDSPNGSGNIDDDSVFELPPPSSTERIMKRLKRGSGHSVLAHSNPQQQVNQAKDISKDTGLGTQNACKGSETRLPEKTSGRNTAKSKGQTLQSFWKGLNDKRADSCAKDNGETRIGSAGQGYGGSIANKSMESLARIGSARQGFGSSIVNKSVESLAIIGEGKIGGSQVNETTTSDFILNHSAQHGFESKAGLWQVCAESPYDEKGDFFEDWIACRDDTFKRFGTCTDDKTYDELTTRNAGQSTAKTLENFGNSLHDQSASLYEGLSSDGKGDNIQKSLNGDKSSSFSDDLPAGNFRENKQLAPIQSSWRSLDVKRRSLPEDFRARCESQSLGKSSENSQMSLKHQPLDSVRECPASASQSKTSTISPSLGNTNALQSFWKSLNEKKSSADASDIDVEEDDIENCSTDDDFEIGTQAARKLSLLGNATTRKSLAVCNAATEHSLDRSSGQRVSIETSANTTSNNSFTLQYSSNKNLYNARASPGSALRSAGNTVSANPGTSQSLFAGDSYQVSPVCNLNKSQTKQRSFSEKLPEATQRNKAMWNCSDDDNEDTLFFSHAQNKGRAFNDRKIPTYASEAKANLFGGNSSLSVDPISTNDPRVANLLRLRFPHFISVSALRQGGYTGSEQVYIDYESQFSGSKAVSCQSGPSVLKQQARKTAARSTTKWRQATQKKQKIAMADNDGWIQTGNRNPTIRRKRGRSGGQQCSQTPLNNDVDASAGMGHWVTERTGKRIYITKDGKKLSGSCAYKQHIKDSGKRFKKTKRRRPRKKK